MAKLDCDGGLPIQQHTKAIHFAMCQGTHINTHAHSTCDTTRNKREGGLMDREYIAGVRIRWIDGWTDETS